MLVWWYFVDYPAIPSTLRPYYSVLNDHSYKKGYVLLTPLLWHSAPDLILLSITQAGFQFFRAFDFSHHSFTFQLRCIVYFFSHFPQTMLSSMMIITIPHECIRLAHIKT
jgi:hypothetical protein